MLILWSLRKTVALANGFLRPRGPGARGAQLNYSRNPDPQNLSRDKCLLFAAANFQGNLLNGSK